MSPAGEGITELGFLYLHTMFIQQGRMETTWTVLRRFGYGEDLDLREDFLLPRYVKQHLDPEIALMSRFDVPYDCSVELSPLGNQFLTDIFEAYDKVCCRITSQADEAGPRWCTITERAGRPLFNITGQPMAGTWLPRYDDNGRHGTGDSTGMACTVEVSRKLPGILRS